MVNKKGGKEERMEEEEVNGVIWGELKKEFSSLDKEIAKVWETIGNFPEKDQIRTELVKEILVLMEKVKGTEEGRKEGIEREVEGILKRCERVSERMGGSGGSKVESFVQHQHILNLMERKQEVCT